MSPEQARGKPSTSAPTSGPSASLLYEMLTGKRLFDGETVSDVLAAVLTREPDWARLPPSTPPGVQRLLRRCLAETRASGSTTSPTRGSSSWSDPRRSPAPRAARRRSRRVAALGRRCRPARVRRVPRGCPGMGGRAARRRLRAIRFSVTPPGVGGMIRAVEVSRDGRRLVYLLSSERRLLLHDFDEFESRPLPGHRGREPTVPVSGRPLDRVLPGRQDPQARLRRRRPDRRLRGPRRLSRRRLGAGQRRLLQPDVDGERPVACRRGRRGARRADEAGSRARARPVTSGPTSCRMARRRSSRSSAAWVWPTRRSACSTSRAGATRFSSRARQRDTSRPGTSSTTGGAPTAPLRSTPHAVG